MKNQNLNYSALEMAIHPVYYIFVYDIIYDINMIVISYFIL